MIVEVSLPQRLGLLVEISGALGGVPVLITTALEAPLVPQDVAQVAVDVPPVLTVMLVPDEPLLQVTVLPSDRI